jgi:predicted HTH domain antitoxin
MPITIELPEDIAQQLETAWGNLSRRALEALAVEGYRSGDLSAGQVAEMLSLSVWETEKFLKEREAYLHYSPEDFRQDIEAQERVLSR